MTDGYYQEKKLIAITAIVCAAVIILSRGILYLGFVPTSSMESTIEAKSFIVGLRTAQSYERGDIVIFKNDGQFLVKRIVAAGGDTIRLEDDTLYINGEKQDEPYIKESPAYSMLEETVPEGEFFMLGDNRNNSRDSRYMGTISEEDVVAKCIFY